MSRPDRRYVRWLGSSLGLSLLLSSCTLEAPKKKVLDDDDGTSGSAGSDGGRNSEAPSGDGGDGPSKGGAGEPDLGAGGLSAGSGGAAGSTNASAGGDGLGGDGLGGADGMAGAGPVALEHFSFFVTSLSAMRSLSGSQDGFGGDLRYGKATGLAGADAICSAIAETSMPGSSRKQWRAFLSTVAGPVHAKDRIGAGPWYDRTGRLVAANLASLLGARPTGADPVILNDLPNEDGVPNHQPDASSPAVDNHDVLTGSTTAGVLYDAANLGNTCNDWTSKVGTTGKPRVGHAWPAGSATNWMSAHATGGCAPGVRLVEAGGPAPGDQTVGAGGGYGAIYCFALEP